MSSPDATPAEPLRVVALHAPSPWLPGTRVAVEVTPPGSLKGGERLEVAALATRVALADVPGLPGTFSWSPEAAAQLKEGTLSVELRILGAGPSEAAAFSVELAHTLAPRLDSATGGALFYGSRVLLRGSGFLQPGEGTCTARWSGTYTPLDASPAPTAATSPAFPVRALDRDLAETRVPVTLGELQAGAFNGDLAVTCAPVSGPETATAAISLSLELAAPTLFALDPAAAWVGERVEVQAGGVPAEASASLALSLQGTFTPWGGAPEKVQGLEIFLEPLGPDRARLVIPAEDQGKHLVAAPFGSPGGRFEGTAALILRAAQATLPGAATPLTLDVRGIRQVVSIRFLPGFSASLERFGLAAARAAIEAGIIEATGTFYTDYAIEIRGEAVSDVDPNHLTIIEIGGPDPNGLGLFGFDNSPGKDVQNLRLFDTIGGQNAQTQADGYPGYGGVFIESMLFWSAHPPGDLPVPASAPRPDPLFDTLFDPLRQTPVTPAELDGQAPPERQAAIQTGKSALIKLVAETAAHELGHALGLANPDGPPGTFHNETDEPGCLMDAGQDRPLAERAALEGAPETRLCHDHPAYLGAILPRAP